MVLDLPRAAFMNEEVDAAISDFVGIRAEGNREPAAREALRKLWLQAYVHGVMDGRGRTGEQAAERIAAVCAEIAPYPSVLTHDEARPPAPPSPA
jgi:hypothetical protein